jgi:hypothetical protein
MKRFRQFGCTEHVCDALDVVCHRCEADFDSCTGQPAHQQTRMPKDAVLDRRDGMLDRASRSLIASGGTRACIRFKASSYKWRAKPRLGAWVQHDFSEQVPQSPVETLYMV